MKRLIYLLFVFAFFAACQEDNAGFETGIVAESVSFKPIAGGAIMYYKLPDDNEVFALRVRYTDAQGNEIMRVGSYACDSLVIAGFDEAQQGVEAKITLCNRQRLESEPVTVTFDTYDSGPVAFFNNVKVEPYWNGFSVVYEGPRSANGYAHVLFAGKNPLTQEPDTLLVESFPITEGMDTLYFSLANPNPTNSVVVRTEDYRGYMVKQQIWTNVESYGVEMLAPTAFNFLDPEGLIVENETQKLGVQYLFDGDTKGVKAFGLGSRVHSTFVAGPNAVGKPFIVEFKEKKIPASIRIYGMLNLKSFFHLDPIWANGYTGVLPNSVSVYVSDDKEDDASWVKMGSYSEPKDAPKNLRWCYRCVGVDNQYELKDMASILSAEPCYITVNLPAQKKEWKYMKIVVDEIFENQYDYVTMNELEIFTKAN